MPRTQQKEGHVCTARQKSELLAIYSPRAISMLVFSRHLAQYTHTRNVFVGYARRAFLEVPFGLSELAALRKRTPFKIVLIYLGITNV